MSDDVRARLEAQMKNRMEAADIPPAGAAPGFRARASRVEVGCLLRSFAILVRADYPLPRALETLGRSTSNPDLAQTVRSVGGRVEAGTPLSTAMAAYPWYFDRVVCSTVLAAEQSAQLGQALSFLADDIDEEIEVRDRAGQALTYPAIVLSASALVVLGVLYFAVPMFQGYLQDAGVKPSGIAAMVYSLSDLVRFPLVPVVIVAGLVGGGLSFRSWHRRDPVGFYRAMGRIPVLGGILMQASLARFVSVFRLLVVSGLPVPMALELAGGTVDNAHLRGVVAAMKHTVEQGRTMGELLRGQRGLPAVFVDMLGLAEETGRLEEILGHLAGTLRGEMSRRVGRISNTAEPLMLMVLGVVVLVIMLAFFMPYIEMLGGLGSMG